MQVGIHGLIALSVLAAASLTIVEATYYCKAPPSVENGRHSGGNHYYFQVGSVIRYWCDDGYNLQGTSQRTCKFSYLTWTYQWDRSAPTCITDHNHTDDDQDDDNDSTDSADHYHTDNDRDDDEDHDDDTTSDRGFNYCSSLSSISNGYVTYYSRQPGSIAKYSCRSGYTLDGNAYRKCLSSGHWSCAKPECKRSGCEKLISPHYGVVIYSSTTVGSYAKYFCKDGYYLVGIRFRKCEEMGWTDKAPICKPILCDRLPSLKYGRIKLSYGYRWNSVATYSCNWGYQLKTDNGDARRVCQEDGSWSGSPPLCIPTECGPLPAPDEGSVHVTSIRVGTIAKYSCNDGFLVKGRRKRICLKTGMWSGDAPTCKRQSQNYNKHW